MTEESTVNVRQMVSEALVESVSEGGENVSIMAGQRLLEAETMLTLTIRATAVQLHAPRTAGTRGESCYRQMSGLETGKKQIRGTYTTKVQ